MTQLVRGERPALTLWEQLLRGLAAFIAVASVFFAGYYIDRWLVVDTEFPFAVNSAAKESLLVGLCLLVFYDVRRWASIAVPLLVAAHVVMAMLLSISIVRHDIGVGHTLTGGNGVTPRKLWFGADIVIAALFLLLQHKAERSRYDLRFLPPCAFRALMALAEILVLRGDREIAPAEVGARVDQYLSGFRARTKWKIWAAFVALAYVPLLALRPPFYVMSFAMRERWIKDRFPHGRRDWLLPRPIRDVRSAFIRTAQQFCFFGYYGDPRAAERVGYVPFSQLRHDYQELLHKADSSRRRVKCMEPADVHGEYLEAPTVIVGTGAGGAMLAYTLAERGQDVLLLERGLHVDPEAFTENEAEQLSNLYADGALTLSLDFRMRVVQGMCVGGSTVVNNAVCFDLPEDVLARWTGPDLRAGLDTNRLGQAFLDVRDFLGVQALGPRQVRNPGGEVLADAINALGNGAGEFEVVDCNIDGCVGSGYCNIGCRFGAKLSALDHTLPLAQRCCPGRVRILPQCRVEKVLMRRGHATGVRARLGDGRTLTVNAGTIVVSAGTIASSIILQRSSLGDGRAGKGLSFNIASPVTLDFPDEVHSERGAQISQYFTPANGSTADGLAFETWFNPVVAQALFMPGWFEEHRANMERYRYMTCLGVVVGSESNGSVKSGLLGDVSLKYEPTDSDFVKLKKGVRLACETGLRAGAMRALPCTFEQMVVRSPADAARVVSDIADDSDLSVNSAHPQGGNPMSEDALKGVVDSSFRVYGTDNVYVCDASVFPSSIVVNPQLTVMALAAYAADEIPQR